MNDKRVYAVSCNKLSRLLLLAHPSVVSIQHASVIHNQNSITMKCSQYSLFYGMVLPQFALGKMVKCTSHMPHVFHYLHRYTGKHSWTQLPYSQTNVHNSPSKQQCTVEIYYNRLFTEWYTRTITAEGALLRYGLQ